MTGAEKTGGFMRRYSLFETGRITPHQFMRNFAISQCIFLSMKPLYIVVAIIIGIALGFLGIDTDSASTETVLTIMFGFISIGIILLFVAVYIFAAFQRFHDMSESGKKAWRLFIPFYNFYIIYLLVTTPSYSGTNQYGPVPEDVENKKKIEYFFVFSILAVILMSYLRQ